MQGPDFCRDAIAEGLAAILPIKQPRLRAAHGWGDKDLPEVDAIVSGEKPHGHLNSAGKAWVEVVIPRMVSARVVDFDEVGDQVFRIRYAVRVYVWTIGDDWNESLDRRDRAAGTVRQALWEFPTLRLQGGDGDVLIEHDRWAEDYGTPLVANSGRHWTTAALGFEAVTQETLAQGRVRQPLGSAQRMAISMDTWGMVPMPPDTPVITDPLQPDPVITEQPPLVTPTVDSPTAPEDAPQVPDVLGGVEVTYLPFTPTPGDGSP